MSPTTILSIIGFLLVPGEVHGKDEGEERANEESENNSLMILLVVFLLIITVLTLWLFKLRKFRFVHETGLCMFYGMIAGAIIRYTDTGIYRKGAPLNVNLTNAPQTLWAFFQSGKNYSYEKSAVLHPHQHKGQGILETKAVFDPEVFFYALLPPIIFFSGYSMKKRFFFRNMGAILTYAFVGTIISYLVFGGLIYVFISMFTKYDFRFQDCLLFGSLISATDPVTVLAIFHDLNVDVDVYAIAFGESVMNDAVAIVLYRSTLSYKEQEFDTASFFEAVAGFFWVFGGSFLLGSVMGLGTALLTKLTNIGQFPLLETALFTLMSYSTFLIAEVAGLTGIVTVLFCGIAQAHYTYKNLTDESQVATKQIFGLLNFLAENFIFSYMGLTVFTFDEHKWDVGFISWTILCCAISRACNIYPLSFLLNIKRTKKIKLNVQHMLWFAGLRGAVAFALAIRNTEGTTRQLMLTSVLVVAILTVVINGSLTTQVLARLGIPVGVDPNEELSTSTETGDFHENLAYEHSWLVRKWHEFDVKYMKPLFTVSGGSFRGEVPTCGRVVRSCCGFENRSSSTEDVYRVDAEGGSVPTNACDDDSVPMEQRGEELTIA